MSNFLKSLKSLLVGGLASIVSLGLLWVSVEVFHVSPERANLPTLALGSLVQFVGNRQWVFVATAGNPVVQLLQFAGLEITSFFLNAWLFSLVIAHAPGHYLLARIGVTALIFWGFSFPLWKWVFKK